MAAMIAAARGQAGLLHEYGWQEGDPQVYVVFDHNQPTHVAGAEDAPTHVGFNAKGDFHISVVPVPPQIPEYLRHQHGSPPEAT